MTLWNKLLPPIFLAILLLMSACSGRGNQDISVDDALNSKSAGPKDASEQISRFPEDEVVYFMLPDRFENGDPTNDTGGFSGDAMGHGFDPTHKGFYQGGDMEGLISQLDYIKALGATAIWLGPIYKNKPVQGAVGQESAGYHGYWITDFLSIDPHFGTNDQMKEFVDTAHAKGMKVYLDIITNHTADVIRYRECHDPDYIETDKLENNHCPYRSKADYPYATRGGIDGELINSRFMGDQKLFQSKENFAELERFDFAYTPYVTDDEKNVKNPAWLNELRYYHNRGETTFEGEDSLFGDFAGLDDVFTEDPFVVEGFIDIFKHWISTYKIDGFRIDTARHVNPEFWQKFLPAVIDHAHDLGIAHFYVFGEVYDPDPGSLARFTRVDHFPLVLDFAFQAAVHDVVAKGEAPIRLEKLFRADDLYEGGAKRARQLPVFVGNHDMGRFSHFVIKENPQASEQEVIDRVKLAHAFMFFARGVPVIYYGDEQGFIGDGHDQDARETMFATQVASYDDNDVLGTEKKSTERNFDRDHPLYVAISSFAKIYHDNPTLRRGIQKIRRAEKTEGGVFALSRIDEDKQEDFLVILNTGNQSRNLNIEIDYFKKDWESVLGNCATTVKAPGSYQVSVRPFETKICKSVANVK